MKKIDQFKFRKQNVRAAYALEKQSLIDRGCELVHCLFLDAFGTLQVEQYGLRYKDFEKINYLPYQTISCLRYTNAIDNPIVCAIVCSPIAGVLENVSRFVYEMRSAVASINTRIIVIGTEI